MTENNESIERKEQVRVPAFQQYLIPLAILVGAGLIAGAVLLKDGSSSLLGTTGDTKEEQGKTGTDAVRAITEEDHVRGDRNAAIKIVEYSDFECPFCKRFHETMNQVMDATSETNDVAWVYRHFPLEQLHPRNAVKVSLASECAAELGGNEAFWKFADRFMELTPANDRTDLTVVLPQIYNEIGLDQSAMESCIASGNYDERIESDIKNAVETGGRGTPWSVVIAPNGKTFPLNGAQPFEAVMQLIDILREEQS